MEKTIGEWFLEAKANGAPWADAAINNTKRLRGAVRFDKLAKSLSDAIIKAFHWQESPEGHWYWAKIHENA